MRIAVLVIALLLTMSAVQIAAKEPDKKTTASKQATNKKTASAQLATYRNGRFGFEISYPKNWQISRSRNGDGFHAASKNQQLRAAASFLGADDEQTRSLPLKKLINYWEPKLKIRKTVECKVPDSYKDKTREALIGYYGEKSNNVIKLVTRDEEIEYQVWATNIPEAIALKLIKTFKITKGEEKN